MCLTTIAVSVSGERGGETASIRCHYFDCIFNRNAIIASRFRIANICQTAEVEAVTTVSRKLLRLQALTDASDGAHPTKHSDPSTTASPAPAVNHMGYNRIPILNKKCADNESDSHACHLFESCTSSFLQLLEEIEYKLARNASEIEAHRGSPQLLDDIVNVRVAFYVGFVLGSIIGAIILCMLQQLCVYMCRGLSQCVSRESKQGNVGANPIQVSV